MLVHVQGLCIFINKCGLFDFQDTPSSLGDSLKAEVREKNSLIVSMNDQLKQLQVVMYTCVCRYRGLTRYLFSALLSRVFLD